MKDFVMEYAKMTGKTNNEGIILETYGIAMVQRWNNGTETKLEIPNITLDENRADELLGLMERGTVTPMTAYEIIEDFLEM